MGYRLGIDLGTTFTAAAVERDGRAEVVPLGDHAPAIPSVVFVREDGEVLVGEAAVRRGPAQPDRLAREFKRQLGEPVPLVLGGQEFMPEQLIAHLLRWVVTQVRARQGTAPDRIALTHPANWGNHRRMTFGEAARLARVGQVTLMTEPAAAAVHFASTERAATGGIVAVYDLGGGTFDAAVLRKTLTEFELLGSPDGVEHLGGIDFDDAVFGFVLRTQADAMADVDTDDPVVIAALARLRRECTDAKEALSTDVEATVHVALPGSTPTTVRLVRAEFEDMIREDVERTVGCMRRALASAEVEPEDVHTVVLVGGSARIPLVAQLLGHDLGRPLAVSPQPKHAVALGAALLAGGVMPVPPVPPPPLEATTRTRPTENRPKPSGPGGPGGGGRARWPDLPPARPRTGEKRLAAAVVGLLVIALLGAFALPLLSRPRAPTDVEVDGSSPAVGAGVSWDFDGQGVQLTLPEALQADTLTARPSVLGLGVGSQEVPVTEEVQEVPATDQSQEVPAAKKEAQIVLDGWSFWAAGPVRLRLLAGTEVDGELVLIPEPADAVVVRWVTPLVLGLFVLAYVEAILRPLRRRRVARGVDIAGLCGVGAVAGIAIVLVSWAIVGNDVTLPALLTTVVACAAAGGVLPLLVAAVSARRRPVRRGRDGT